MTEIEVVSWSDFERDVVQHVTHRRQELESQNHGRRFAEPLFRGLGSSDWKLETTLERSYPMERCDSTQGLLEYYRKILAVRPSIETFTGKLWPIPDLMEFKTSLSPGDFLFDDLLRKHSGVYEYLIFLRHHGFPSPLLDWTASPYVAAFFAFDEMARTATHVSIYALLQDTITSYSNHRPNVRVLGPYVRSHPRHMLQHSRYSVCLQVQDEEFFFVPHEDALTKAVGAEGELIKFKLPGAERTAALRHLDLMNINPFALFSSDDSLIRTTARRECLFRSWNI
jgi:hypothetical protein